MWYLISLENPDNKYVLLGERSYVVGRRNCDIILAGDPTVSRKHAELSVSHDEANLASLTKLPVLLLKDLSKFGTWVNKEKVSGEKILKDGDVITFGSDKSLYTVVYEPMVITSSCLDNASKKLVRQQLSILGGHMIGEWTSDCSIVVMNKISVTIKVICALVSLKHIVLPSYLEHFVKHLQGTNEKPDPTEYTPVIAETQLDPNEVSFAPDSKRKTLFQGMKFVFLSQKQLKKLNQAIELAGGMTLLMEEKGDDGTLLEEGTVVMNCQESELTPRGVKWAKHVQELLQSHDKHMIQDAEIGYAVLYSSTEKHCNPDYIPDRDLSRLPSQSLSQVEVIEANTETQHRTQTQSHSQRTLTSGKNQQSRLEPSQAKPSPGPSQRKESRKHSRSPSPVKLSSPRHISPRHSRSPSPGPQSKSSQQKSSSPGPKLKSSRHKSPSPGPKHKSSRHKSPSPGPQSKSSRHSRSASPGPQMAAKVKEEPKSQPDSVPASKKRSRPIIEDDSDEELAVPPVGKRVKVEPVTPRSKTGTDERKKASMVSKYVSDSDENENEDEFDKIDARMSSKRNRKTSPQRAKHTSPSVSPNRAERVSPVRQTNINRRKSPSPGLENVASARVKTEVTSDRSGHSDIDSETSRGRSGEGQLRSGIEKSADLVSGGIKSRSRGVGKIEVENNDYEMSSVVPVEDSEDIKPAISNVAVGFLSTRRPIEDQVQRNREFEVEPDQPSNCIKVEVVSLVARKSPIRDKDDVDCPEGFTRWKGKLVKNFKKFRKVQAGHLGLPTVIGGSDLVVHVPHRSKEMDDWFKETMQAESQHASEERRAQELFDFNPSRRKGR